VQHGEEYRPLHGELKPAIVQQGAQDLRHTQLLPQPLEEQWRTDLDRFHRLRLPAFVGLQYRGPFGEAGAGGDQGVDPPRVLQDVEASQGGDHLLADVTVHAFAAHQLQILVGPALLGSDEH